MAVIDTLGHGLWSAATTNQASDRCWCPLSSAFLMGRLLGPPGDLSLCTKGIDTLDARYRYWQKSEEQM